MPCTFAIVNFIDSNEIEIVPLSWVKDNMCVWPPFKACQVQKMVKRLHKPSQDWITHAARVIGRYDTFEIARSHLRKAEDVSDLTSDPDAYGTGKRNIVPVRAISSDEDSTGLTFAESTGIVVPTIVPQHSLDSAEQIIASTPIIQQPAVVNIGGLNGTSNDSNLDVAAALKLLTKEIMVVKANQKLIMENQEQILNKLCASTAATQLCGSAMEQQVLLPICLPVNSVEDLQILEIHIEDPSIREYLVHKMSCCGGNSVDKTVKRIIQKLMTDSVAQKYSWLGAKGKEVFSNLKLTEIIFAAVRSNTSLGVTVTDAAIELAIKNWLRHAKARFSSKIVKDTNQESQSLL